MKRKKLFARGLIIVTAVCMALASVACKKDVPHEEKPQNTVTKGSAWFTENGRSDYKIVVSSEARDEITFAKEELIYFVEQIADCKLETVSDRFAAYDEKATYISLGRNELFEKTDIDLSAANVGNSGYVIQSVGNTVFITGDGAYDYGTIFGVYEFLKYTFGMEIYATDCITYNAEKNVKMPVFDVKERPDTDRFYFEGARTDYIGATRLGMINVTSFTPSMAQGHSLTGILKMSSDYVGKDWLTAQDQLCFSASEMYPVFAKNLIRIIDENPDASRFFLGNSDAVTQCTCNRCIAMKEEYHTNSAGLMMIFFNHVLDTVCAYTDAHYPDREIEFSTYAYEGVFEPPVKSDGNGGYVPDSEAVIPHKRLKIMYTPLLINNMHTLDEVPNKANFESLIGWASVASEIEMYGYNYYTRATTVTAGTFNTFSDTIRRLKNAGCTYYYEEGPKRGENFVSLKLYVQSKLCKDTSLSYDETAYDFIEHYYGPAAGAMKKFYQLFKNYYASNRENMPGACQTPISSIYSVKFLQENFLNTQITLLEEANRAIEDLKTKDRQAYETYLWRIREEEFPARVNRLQVYSSSMSATKIKEEVEKIRNWPNSLPNGSKYEAPGSQLGVVVKYDTYFTNLLK